MLDKSQHLFSPIIPHEIVRKDNGEIYSAQFNDIFFQSQGQQESAHVFCLGNQLEERFQSIKTDENNLFIIGEVGFGTGLNFINVMRLWETHAPKGARLHYVSSEKHPLTHEDLSYALSSIHDLKSEANKLIAAYPTLTPGWHRIHFNSITLTLMLEDCVEGFLNLLPTNHIEFAKTIKSFSVDAWFLDGFSPKENKACWRDDLFKTMAALSDSNTTLATFSVARNVKDNLIQNGFDIKKAKGFGHKREMLTATFKNKVKKSVLQAIPASKYHTPWQSPAYRAPKHKKVIVIGAGLAGAGIAYQLAKRHYQVTVVDRAADVASGASGNPVGILDIKLSHAHSPLTDFNLSAFLYAVRFYRSLGIESNQGLLRVVDDEKEKKYQDKLNYLVDAYPELAEYLSHSEMREHAGIKLNQSGVLIKQAGILYPRTICQQLLTHSNIQLSLNKAIQTIHYKDDKWHCDELEADILVFANSMAMTTYYQGQHLPIKPYPGELMRVEDNHLIRDLKLPISNNGYITPAVDHQQYIGEGETLDRLLGIKKENTTLLRKGVRARTPDYLPLVGPVPCRNGWDERFELLKKDKNYFIPKQGLYQKNLYVLTGFGSHGLRIMPISSEILASCINNEPFPLPRSLQCHLSAGRQIIKELY